MQHKLVRILVLIGVLLAHATQVFAAGGNYVKERTADPMTANSFVNILGCPINPLDCLSDLTDAAMPNIDVDVNIKAPELISAINEASDAANQAIAVMGGESRLTLETAARLMTDYTAFLDGVAAGRIADVDGRVTAKLLWIEQYTAQVKGYSLDIVQATSAELQTVVAMATGGLKKAIEAAGAEARYSIVIAGEQARITVHEVGKEAQEFVLTTSIETQRAISHATASLRTVVDQTIEGIRTIEADFERMALRSIGGMLVLVERSADLALAVFGPSVGLIFMFIASIGWGKAVMQFTWPDSPILHRLTWVLFGLTYFGALLPFALVSQDVRALLLLRFDQAKIINPQFEPHYLRLPVLPDIRRCEPAVVVVDLNAVTAPRVLTCSGSNLVDNSVGLPSVTYGIYDLPILSYSNDQFVVDLAQVYANPRAANQIVVRYPETAGGVSRAVEVRVVEPTATPPFTATPTQTPPPPTSTQAAQSTFRVTNAGGANIRRGPCNYPILGFVKVETTLTITGKHATVDWWQVQFTDSHTGQTQLGWVWGPLGIVSELPGLPVYDLECLPFAKPTPEYTRDVSGGQYRFWADVDKLKAGSCTILHWDVESVKAVGVKLDQSLKGVTGHETREVCLQKTTTFWMRVIFVDKRWIDVPVTIVVAS